jgi:aminoglycoside phosphotransferase (APT) family kinase protein
MTAAAATSGAATTTAPGSAATGADADVERRLREFLAEQLPGCTDLGITNLRRTSSGFSRENWPFDVTWRPGGSGDAAGALERAELIMRRDPVGSVLVTDRREEFAVLRALEASPVPAPRARFLDADGSFLERPAVIMDRVGGECDWFVVNGDRPLEVRLSFARRALELLAAIHAVDWRATGLGPVLGEPPPGTGAAAAALDRWEAELRRQQLEPFPELEVVLGWLRANEPVAQTTALVHGDFKPGNMLLAAGPGEVEIVAMLDWETAHLGDPLEDVGWITNPLRRREHQIPGEWERADIMRAYAEITGLDVSDADVRFWNVLANFKLAVIVLTGVRSFVEGRGDRVFGAPNALVALMFDLIGL